MKEFVYAITLGRGDFYGFVEAAKKMKKSFLAFQFLIVTLLLYLPLFYSLVKIEPDVLYGRMYGLSFDKTLNLTEFSVSLTDFTEKTIAPSKGRPGIFIKESFTEEDLPQVLEGELWFCFSKDMVAVYDSYNKLAVTKENGPAVFFSPKELEQTDFGTIFNYIAVRNNYFGAFLLPAMGIIFIVLIILQLLFYLILTVLLGTYRMNSSRMSFIEKLRILLMCSAPAAFVSMMLGFALPAVHLIVFELAVISLGVYSSKRYDKKEKELMLKKLEE